MKELVCDGSGRQVFYKEHGKSYLLCETTEPHIHCECGPALIPAKFYDPKVHHCFWCNLQAAGFSLHENQDLFTESREHVFAPVVDQLDKELEGGISDQFRIGSDEINWEVVE